MPTQPRKKETDGAAGDGLKQEDEEAAARLLRFCVVCEPRPITRVLASSWLMANGSVYIVLTAGTFLRFIHKRGVVGQTDEDTFGWRSLGASALRRHALIAGRRCRRWGVLEVVFLGALSIEDTGQSI